MARILVAEHNKAISSYLMTSLKQAGHNVVLTESSLEAWRVSGQFEFDILIVDIVMPGMDGFVLAQKALQANPYLHVIFVTGFAAVAMDTYNSPEYAPQPMTTAPFHLKDIGTRIRYMMGDLTALPVDNYNKNNTEGTENIVYADFGRKRKASSK